MAFKDNGDVTLLVSCGVITIKSLRVHRSCEKSYLLFKFIEDDLHKYIKRIKTRLSIVYIFCIIANGRMCSYIAH